MRYDAAMVSGCQIRRFHALGLYSVKGIGESWSFYKGEISYEDYMAQASGFTATVAKIKPDGPADLFEGAGGAIQCN